MRRILKKRAEDPQELDDYLTAREKCYKRGYGQDNVIRRSVAHSRQVRHGLRCGMSCNSRRILPFRRNNFLGAILTCEEDHVRFVQDELAGADREQRNCIEIIRAYIQKNREEFIDLRKLPANHEYGTCPGYTNVHKGRPEYLFLHEKLQEELGGMWDLQELKKQLHGEEFISTASMTNRGLLYVATRSIRGKKRQISWGYFRTLKMIDRNQKKAIGSRG